MDREFRGAQLFMEGYNCAQAVIMAFSDLLGMDEKTCAKISSSFGGGMGRMREVLKTSPKYRNACSSSVKRSDPETLRRRKAKSAFLRRFFG
ncbi:MAG: C_GCAxxG_C_C family protein [Clostridia bacterium]|nr:C_GCAxxG_C_C family protein [Clostridia bacterium]